jgi:hypothetical protein
VLFNGQLRSVPLLSSFRKLMFALSQSSPCHFTLLGEPRSPPVPPPHPPTPTPKSPWRGRGLRRWGRRKSDVASRAPKSLGPLGPAPIAKRHRTAPLYGGGGFRSSFWKCVAGSRHLSFGAGRTHSQRRRGARSETEANEEAVQVHLIMPSLRYQSHRLE